MALAQTEEALEQLRAAHAGVEFQVVAVHTGGDLHGTAPLPDLPPDIGQGVFVKEIEQQLLAGNLDMAVHSLKDLPTVLPPGLSLGAVVKRIDPRDALVNRWDCPLDQLPQGARIGTSSPRRRAQLMDLCPQAEVLPMRGNVPTRLEKAYGPDYDGAVLAAAGLVRLEETGKVAEYLSAQEFVPPPGQGVLAIQVREDDAEMLEFVRPLEDSTTRFAVTAERAFLEKLGGGCTLPVGAFARSTGDNLLLTIFLSSADGKKCFRAKILGLPKDPLQLAGDAYMALLERGGRALLASA